MNTQAPSPTPASPTTFAVTFDYRCPFARNAHEQVLAALAGGAPWEVRFVPFSLGQVHVAEGETPIWDRPGDDSGLTALAVGVLVRDRHPDVFLAVHGALFAARHDHSLDLRDHDVLSKVLVDAGLDPGPILADVPAGLAVVRAEHEAVAASHEVWGVPTFLVGDQAAFVRLMDRPGDDPTRSVAAIERIVGLLRDVPELNEFKHTSIPR